MQTETQQMPLVDRLEKLGLGKASSNIKLLAVKQRKMAIAYEHYRYVRQEKINAFNAKLRGKATQFQEYKTLSFTAACDYPEVPPTHVLDNLQAAIDRQCFDSFEVAHIVNVPDPIMFGRIAECPDRFFIDQWDDDVKIEDILKPNEG